MGFTMIWPILVVLGADIVYQICAKSTPSQIDPFASLAVTYGIAAAASLGLYFLLNRGGNLAREYLQLNWTSWLLGVAVVGLEVGTIYMYRVGWDVGVGYVVKSSVIAVAMILVGRFLFHEAITPSKMLGVVICAIGLYFINK